MKNGLESNQQPWDIESWRAPSYQ